ncbi:MAG TPA: response regulator [Gemmatimonadaceae bacterium]|jgi:DNA-binding response OmpR family regulator
MNEIVVIVDDSLTVRMDLADAFDAAGFRTIPCASVAEGRATLERGEARVFVLDVLLPDGNGVEFTEEIRRSPDGASAIVVMLSSEAEVTDRARGLRTGADEYVGKPYDVGYLVGRVRELLQARDRSAGGGTTILVIDDSVTFREALRTAFETAGHKVIVAPTGEEGLRAAATVRPDAIVVDGELPGIDGPTVIRHVRLDAALRDVPCVLMTASDDKGAELRALDAGADTFVRKEEATEVILARLAAVLRRTDARTRGDEKRSVLGPKKILAVCGDAAYVNEVTNALRGEGYDIVVARSGEEALELIAMQQMDCILLDLMVPGLGGQETCVRIKGAPIVRDIPIIMLGALDTREAMIQGLGAGADDYIAKGSEFDVLKARVRAQIRRRQFEDENRRVREELLRREIDDAEAQAARELAQARAVLIDELERRNADLEAFSYSVSHDLRAPLRAIQGFSQALLDDNGEQLDDAGKDYAKRVITAAIRMDQLIRDLLDYSRISRAEVDLGPVDLNDIARDALDQLAADITSSGGAVDVARRLPKAVGHRATLVQAVANLVANALKFVPKGRPPEIKVYAEESPGLIRLWIQDNGIGIEPMHQERVFGVFERLHRNDVYPGTGIGLAIVRKAVERMGGRVGVRSVPGEGSRFWIELPGASAAA